LRYNSLKVNSKDLFIKPTLLNLAKVWPPSGPPEA
jgi:hypothetical protein